MSTIETQTSVEQELASLLDPVRQRFEAAKIEREEVAASLSRLDRGIEKMYDLLTRAGLDVSLPEGFAPVEPSKPSRSKRKTTGSSPVGVTRANGTSTGYGISMELAVQYAEAIRQLVARRETEGDPPFVTQKEIYLAMGTDQGTASSAFRWLRTIEFLRKAGKDSSQRRELWAIMDDGAPERYLQAAREAADRAFFERHAHVERAIEYLKEHRQIEGWQVLAEAIGVTAKYKTDILRKYLVDNGMVEVVKRPGTTSLIKWKGADDVAGA